MSRRLPLVLVTTLALIPAAAHADGLPVGNVDAGPTGITTPGGADRIVTLAADRGTVVARVSRAGGQVQASRAVRGTLAIPAVALDGTGGGLSGDGRTVVVIQPRTSFPRRV